MILILAPESREQKQFIIADVALFIILKKHKKPKKNKKPQENSNNNNKTTTKVEKDKLHLEPDPKNSLYLTAKLFNFTRLQTSLVMCV